MKTEAIQPRGNYCTPEARIIIVQIENTISTSVVDEENNTGSANGFTYDD